LPLFKPFCTYRQNGKKLNRLVSLEKKIVNHTKSVLFGESSGNRIYSLHEPDVAVIKKGRHCPDCEFGATVNLVNPVKEKTECAIQVLIFKFNDFKNLIPGGRRRK